MSKKKNIKSRMGKIGKYNCNEIHTNFSNKKSRRSDLAKIFSKKYKIRISDEDFNRSATRGEVAQYESNKYDFPIEEVWNTKNTLARLIVPRLKAFKQLDKHCYPTMFGDMDNWNQNIQMMIDAFELVMDNRCLSEEEIVIVTEGLFYFGSNFCDLRD